MLSLFDFVKQNNLNTKKEAQFLIPHFLFNNFDQSILNYFIIHSNLSLSKKITLVLLIKLRKITLKLFLKLT